MNLKPLDDRIVVKASISHSTSKLATLFCTASTAEPKSPMVETTFLFSPAATYSQLLPDFLTIYLQHAKDQNKHGQAIEV